MKRLCQQLILVIILMLVNVWGWQPVQADTFHFTVTANQGELIVVESTSAAFSVTLPVDSQRVAHSHQAYSHIAVLTPPTLGAASFTVITNNELSSTASEFSVYAEPASPHLLWLAGLSQQPGKSPDLQTLHSAMEEASATIACLARTLLARAYLNQQHAESALDLLAVPDAEYACWQHAALAMTAFFERYHFTEASHAGMALLPDSVAEAFSAAQASTVQADEPPPFSSTPVFTLPHVPGSFIHTQLLSSLGFSQVLHGSIASSQTLMETGKLILEQALLTASNNNYRALLPDIYNGLATYWSLANDNAASARYLELAVQTKLDTNNQQGVAEFLNNLGLVYLWSGRWTEAQQTLREATQYISDDATTLTTAVVMANLASSYLYLGDTQIAQRYYEQALTLSQGPVTDDDIAHIYIALARIAMAAKNWPSALIALNQAASDARRLRPDKLPLIMALQAQAFANNGQFADAREAMTTARHMLDDIVKPADSISARLALTDTQLHLTDYPEAAKNIATLSAVLASDDPLQVELATLQYRWLQTNDPDNEKALNDTFAFASQQVMDLGARLDAYQMGPHWFNKVRGLYNVHLDTLLAAATPEHLHQVLGILETYQSQLFLRKRQDHLRHQRLSQPQLNALWQQRLTLESQLVNHNASADQQAIQQQLDRINEEWLGLLNPQPQLAERATPDSLQLVTIQAALRPEQVILRYIQTDQHCVVIAITPNDRMLQHIRCLQTRTAGLSGAEIVHHYRHAKATEFIPRRLLDNPQYTDIIWLADGAFYTLPLAQLTLPDGQYLGTRYTLRQTPSLSTYLNSEKANHNQPLRIGIFDAPRFANVSSERPSGWRNRLPNLPWAKAEGDSIVSRFTHTSVSRFSGAKATQQALTSTALREATLLHVATHSYFDAREPEIVGLAVARSASGSADDTGFFPQSALLSEPFENQLVVLSGCETALGKQMAHDGLHSLAYGMLSAGADSVISTRWKVADKAAAAFMDYFYDALSQTGNSATAMRYARQQMQRHPRFKHPMHWAGYSLTVVNQQAEQFTLP